MNHISASLKLTVWLVRPGSCWSATDSPLAAAPRPLDHGGDRWLLPHDPVHLPAPHRLLGYRPSSSSTPSSWPATPGTPTWWALLPSWLQRAVITGPLMACSPGSNTPAPRAPGLARTHSALWTDHRRHGGVILRLQGGDVRDTPAARSPGDLALMSPPSAAATFSTSASVCSCSPGLGRIGEVGDWLLRLSRRRWGRLRRRMGWWRCLAGAGEAVDAVLAFAAHHAGRRRGRPALVAARLPEGDLTAPMGLGFLGWLGNGWAALGALTWCWSQGPWRSAVDRRRGAVHRHAADQGVALPGRLEAGDPPRGAGVVVMGLALAVGLEVSSSSSRGVRKAVIGRLLVGPRRCFSLRAVCGGRPPATWRALGRSKGAGFAPSARPCCPWRGTELARGRPPPSWSDGIRCGAVGQLEWPMEGYGARRTATGSPTSTYASRGVPDGGRVDRLAELASRAFPRAGDRHRPGWRSLWRQGRVGARHRASTAMVAGSGPSRWRVSPSASATSGCPCWPSRSSYAAFNTLASPCSTQDDHVRCFASLAAAWPRGRRVELIVPGPPSPGVTAWLPVPSASTALGRVIIRPPTWSPL